MIDYASSALFRRAGMLAEADVTRFIGIDVATPGRHLPDDFR